MNQLLTFILILTASLAYGQVTILEEHQHLAILKQGQKIFLDRGDYMKDKIFLITNKEDTVIVLEADETYFKFQKDTLIAWALTNQLDEFEGVITKPTIYDIKTPFKHILNLNTYGYDQGNKMANKILDLKKGEIIVVVKKENEFFQVTYKDKTAYLVETDIIPSDPRHPIKKAKYEKTYTKPIPIKSTGKTYYRGARGGCYYINSSGKKVYVDHSYCNN